MLYFNRFVYLFIFMRSCYHLRGFSIIFGHRVLFPCVWKCVWLPCFLLLLRWSNLRKFVVVEITTDRAKKKNENQLENTCVYSRLWYVNRFKQTCTINERGVDVECSLFVCSRSVGSRPNQYICLTMKYIRWRCRWFSHHIQSVILKQKGIWINQIDYISIFFTVIKQTGFGVSNVRNCHSVHHISHIFFWMRLYIQTKESNKEPFSLVRCKSGNNVFNTTKRFQCCGLDDITTWFKQPVSIMSNASHSCDQVSHSMNPILLFVWMESKECGEISC